MIIIAQLSCIVKISDWISGVYAMGYYKRIRELREDHDLTQRQLAAILNITQPQYFRYEQGYRDIPTDLLLALADLYGTSTDYILGRVDVQKSYGKAK